MQFSQSEMLELTSQVFTGETFDNYDDDDDEVVLARLSPGQSGTGQLSPGQSGPTVRLEKMDDWAPHSWAPGPDCPGPNLPRNDQGSFMRVSR